MQATLTQQLATDWSARIKARWTDSSSTPEDTNTFSGGLQPDGRTIVRDFIAIDQDFQTYAIDASVQGELHTGPLEHQMLFGVDAHITRFDSTAFFAPAPSLDIFNPVYGLPRGPLIPLSPQERDVDLYGFYLQDLVSIGKQWKILLGGRFDYAKTDFERNAVTLADKVDQEFSPRVGLVYQPVDELSLYASYAKSFIPPLTGQTASGAEFEPEKGKQIELGVKGAWLEERLSTTFSIFELTRQNVSTGDPANPGFEIQVGEQRSRGAELEMVGEIVPGWQVIGSLTWLDAEITEDNEFPVGNRLTNVPEWSGSLWTTYEFRSGALRGLELGAGVFAVGEREGDLDNSFDVPAYARVDLLARYEVTENVGLSVNVHNLFDTTYVEAASSSAQIEPGPPLTVFATFDLHF